jgi:SAM-dependent methyltransferase
MIGIKTIKKLLPRPLKSRLRRIYYEGVKPLENFIKKSSHFLPDTLEVLSGKRDRLTPPNWRNFVGGGDFKIIGNEFFRYFVELGGLKPHEKILEVGCGIGRMAVPLMGYLKKEKGGNYEGFDIVDQGVDWCQKKITRTAPHFHFRWADIYNYGYNPVGKYPAEEYQFPYENESFDFVFLTSVFTHMLPPGMENYFSEISRVLKQGGRCFITFFLLTRESLELIEINESTIDFKYEINGYRVKNQDVPERAVAYDENYIRWLYGKNNLQITPPIHYGWWYGREKEHSVGYQDFILAVKNVRYYLAHGIDQYLVPKIYSQKTPAIRDFEVVYQQGWYPPETDLTIQEPGWQHWRWTAKKALCKLENPKRKALLLLRGAVNKSIYEDQLVSVKLNDTILDEFIPGKARFFKRYVIPVEMMGKNESITLGIETNKTFVPSEMAPGAADSRELGLQVYQLFFGERI